MNTFKIDNYQIIDNYNFDTQAGLTVLVRGDLVYRDLFLHESGRLISLKVQHIGIIAAYAKSGSQHAVERNIFFYNVLAAELHKYHNYPTLVLADMNATRKLGDSTSGRNMSRALQTIFADFNLIDMWETLHPGLAGHSYFYPKGSSRIDIIYASQHFRQNFNQISTERLIFSDHLMIRASIKGAITTHLVSKFHCWMNQFWKTRNTYFWSTTYGGIT